MERLRPHQQQENSRLQPTPTEASQPRQEGAEASPAAPLTPDRPRWWEKKKAYDRRYRQEHKAEHREQQSRYRQKHKAEIKAYEREYKREYMRRYRQEKRRLQAEQAQPIQVFPSP
jgi:hypothetical protein